MFEFLDTNIPVRLLDVLDTIFCFVPGPFNKYSQQIRARSRYARYSLQVHQENGVDTERY